MPLKYKFKTKEEIPAEHLPLYAERDGGWVLDVDGAVDKSKLDEFRTTNVTLLKERDELKKRGETFFSSAGTSFHVGETFSERLGIFSGGLGRTAGIYRSAAVSAGPAAARANESGGLKSSRHLHPRWLLRLVLRTALVPTQPRSGNGVCREGPNPTCIAPVCP